MNTNPFYLHVSPSGSIGLIQGEKILKHPNDRVFVERAEQYITVRVDSEIVRSIDARADDYAWSNAENHAHRLKVKLLAEYEAALERAKAEAVPVADQDKEKALDMMWRNDPDMHNPISFGDWQHSILKPGSIYGPFTSGYEVKSVLVLEKNTPGVSRIRHYEKRAILSETQQEKEESQDELWIKVMVEASYADTEGIWTIIKRLQEQFTINRK